MHEQVNKITGGETPTVKLARNIVLMCSSWNFPKIFAGEDPTEIATLCRSLVDRGFLKLFDDNGLPSFVPVGSTRIVAHSYRDFTQADV